MPRFHATLAVFLGLVVFAWSAGPARAQRAAAAASAPSTALPKAKASAPASKERLSPELRRFAEECDSLRRGTILQLEHELRGLKNESPDTKNHQSRLLRAEADLEAIRSGQQLPMPTLRFPFAIGNLGRLPGGGAHVEKILGPQEMLVRVSFSLKVVVTRHYERVREVTHQTLICKVRGIDTQPFSVGNDTTLLQVFQVAEKQTSRVGNGKSAQIYVLTPVDMKPVEAYLRSLPAP